MKMIWMLAAAASLAACGGRGEDEMGAAPDLGDTTAVTTGVDTSTVTGAGQAADTAMVPTTPTDSTYGNPPAAVDSIGTSNIPSETGVPTDSAWTPGVDTTSAR